MINWSKGFSARYYLTQVDQQNWKDLERFEITGGTIKRSTGELRHSATIEAGSTVLNGEPLIRVWLEATQEGESSRIPLFTGYATSPSRSINGTLIEHSFECYSVLKPAADVLLPRGWYAPVDINVIDQVKELLKVTNVPVAIVGDTFGLTLGSAVIAEQNETNLSMAEVLLKSANWRLLITGSGQIILTPYSFEAVEVFDARTNDIVEPQVKDSYDWYSCPNVIRVVLNDTYAEWKDEDPKSRWSIPNRGREVWVEETSPKLNDRETLTEYAIRRLAELQQVGRTVSYSRRFRPDIFPEDVVALNYPQQDLLGNFMVTEQTISLGYGASMEEGVMQI